MVNRVISLILTCAVLAGLSCSACAVSTHESGVTTEGIALSQEAFAQRYGSYSSANTSNSVTTVTDTQTYTNTSITVESATVNGTQVTVLASVMVGNTRNLLVASGTLYNSIKTQHGTNSIVGVLNDSMGNYNILHFEIYNDTSEDIFYSNEEWRGTPHLKIYLQSKSDNSILLFETAIPTALSNLSIQSDEQALYIYDGGWFLPFVPYEVTTSESDSSVAIPYDATWYTYSLPAVSVDTSLNGTSYTFTSNASIQYKLNNLTSEGNWSIQFGIDRCTQVMGGTEYSSTGGWISYSDISFDIGAGRYTDIREIKYDGSVSCLQSATLSNIADGADILVGVAGLAFGELGTAVPAASIALSALSLISSMNVGYVTVELGGEGYDSFDPETVAIKTQMNPSHQILTTSQGYDVSIRVEYGTFSNPNAPTSVSTYGMLRFRGEYGIMNYSSTSVTYTSIGTFDSGNLQDQYTVADTVVG